jgi:hypothetical protein
VCTRGRGGRVQRRRRECEQWRHSQVGHGWRDGAEDVGGEGGERRVRLLHMEHRAG